MSELALKLIAENKAKHERGEDATCIELGRCGLSELPNALFDMYWLEKLILSNEWWEFDTEQKKVSQNNGNLNRLQKIEGIQFLKKLKILIISGIKELDDISPLSALPQLQLLDCRSTQINSLSPLSALTQLQLLECRSTQIKDLSPLSSMLKLKRLYCSNTLITDLSPLSSLNQLQRLDLSSNRVSDISPISFLINLQRFYFARTQVANLLPLSKLLKLESIDCSSTLIQDLSPISELIKIFKLDCSNTAISDLSPLLHFSNLKYLDCYDTFVRDLTPLSSLSKLQKIDCSNTGVSSLLPLYELIKNGKKVQWSNFQNGDINVHGCPLDSPPSELLRKGNTSIIRFFDEIKSAAAIGKVIRLAEAKCLILGEGGAGKTSLAKKLLDQTSPLPEEQATTKGIGVYPVDLKLKDVTQKDISDFRLNIWDFGGQEIYHATHQFFLTKRSLYILLDDTRKDGKTVNDPSFNYWLQVAQLYGGNSPLLIVQNEKGDRSKQLDLRGMQGRFGFVKDSKATNLLTCRGLDEVWQAIEYWLKQLPHIGEEQPKAWVDIRRELERLAREEGLDHIPLEEYYRICAQHDIPERERALFLSSYLHDFGAFLHFQDHPLLRKTLVLNNQWATDAVYKVLDCEEVKGSFGRFTRSTLGRIWADDRYADQHDELLALMEKFELCYKLPDERADTWLAPQLLSVLQPDALDWESVTEGETQSHTLSELELQIRYEYEFMPKGLLSQHIVRNHRYIRQTELVWKSGVVFERAGSQALVTEAWGSRNIRIRARGTNAKELLTLLSEDFDKMHERLEGLKVRKMIPCNCPKCTKSAEPHFYDHEKLLRRKMDGKRTVECDLSYEDVSVAGLLDGIFAKNIQENRKKLFISYSKSDKAHLEDFKKQLSPFRRQNLVEIWDDSKIGPGEEWDKAIKRELATADIIILLISADLINTDYIWDVEMKEAMERHERKEATVIPVIIRSCAWEKAPFGKLNALPEKGVPVEKWTDKDEAWTQVVKRIESLL